jgi:hypothetical protein
VLHATTVAHIERQDDGGMARATAEETDPYLAPAEDTPVRAIAPDLMAVLRARRDRALAHEAAGPGSLWVAPYSKKEGPSLCAFPLISNDVLALSCI